MSLSIRASSSRGRITLSSVVMLAIALSLLMLQTPSALAAAPRAQARPLDVLCVEGQVIDHEEQPLRRWTVTATPAENTGDFEPISAVSDRRGEFRIDLPAPGRWNFTIEIPEDWQPVTAPEFQINVGYGSTDCVNIRFKVEQIVIVTVLKIDDDHNPLPDWEITATPGAGNRYAEAVTETTDENGLAVFRLSPGRWIFSEAAPNYIDWWMPVAPRDGIQHVNVTAPGPHIIRFKNIIKRGAGCIDVIKLDVPPDTSASGEASEPFGLSDWPIEVVRANGTIAAEGETDAFGQISFSDLPFGPYTVRERVLPGWEPVTPTAYEVVLTPDDDGCQVIEFNNRQVEKGFCIAGYKLDQNGLFGIPDWEIDATPLDDGGVDPDPVLTNGEGKFRIDLPSNDYRVPGSTYEVCETPQGGWTAVGPMCYTVTVPEHEGACVYTPEFINRQTQTEEMDENDEQNDMDEKDEKEPPSKPDDEPKRPDLKNSDHKGRSGACRAYHTVRRGESLSKIGPRYGMSVQDLLKANPWVRHQRNLWVYTGQKLCVR